ncbi:ribbon-helix-helix domain-containing protein [Mesorhizobium sp. C416B]|uniref:ribbon-helix-helix domain-containing protein n=1 Tax=unclassified Mesorhizobium TaxID=325217 RepID=UPI0003CEFAB1|nr:MULTISPECIES: ribbon-helix-helix domain-containing protein [unclassified Mesorhizobium]ESX47542.1 plasmid stabilization protein [Mesorhizobium sp. LSHC426A00]ESX51627.1 plasmid stabilization protein [Mesorhizobium sp. LSHC424B00]ESX69722.1 plasmid stabilization protein [Mesorhizobium sp. LSHC416B00]WJI63882.1 ribbon-helix-helix domain-containing protein [Mesorhizobium sp. C416B]
MRTTQPLTITLPHDLAQMVKDKVSSGKYASESEVIRDGLRTLVARDSAMQRWLLEEVVPTLEDARAHPERLLTAEEVRKNLSDYARKVTARPRTGA